jgi:hypothetical protein
MFIEAVGFKLVIGVGQREFLLLNTVRNTKSTSTYNHNHNRYMDESSGETSKICVEFLLLPVAGAMVASKHGISDKL